MIELLFMAILQLKNPMPLAPSGLATGTVTTGSIALSWTPYLGIFSAGQKLDRATDAGFTQNLVTQTMAGPTTAAFTDTGLNSGQTYYYRVYAFNLLGNSAFSNTANATTIAGGLNVPLNRYRIWWNTAPRLALATAYYNAAPYTPGPINTGSPSSDYTEMALAWIATGNTAYALALKNSLIAETSSNSTLGWLMQWAVKNTFNTSGQGAVGGYASEAPNDPRQVTASDHYRYADWVPWVFDWIYTYLTPAERDKIMNGWTTTWPLAGANFNVTVHVPGFSQIAIAFLNEAWGGTKLAINPGGNYAWGYARNAAAWAVAVWYEDPTTAATLWNDFNNNGWPVMLTYNASGDVEGGIAVEGSEYGRYLRYYPLNLLTSLVPMGRDLYEECSFWKDAISAVTYSLTPQVAPGASGFTYWQIPPFGDSEFSSGYPAVSRYGSGDSGQSYFDGGAMASIAQKYASQTVGKYARFFLSLTGATVEKYIASTDPGGAAQDWRNDNLNLSYRALGMDTIISRSNWGTNATLVYQQLRNTTGDLHHHEDRGSWQVLRGDRWLSKESAGYSEFFAGLRYPGVVAASPAPTSSAFGATNLPATANYFSSPNQYTVKFTTGALAGQSQLISGYSSAGVITAASAFTAAPAAGDTFLVYPMQPAALLVDYKLSAPHNTPLIGCKGVNFFNFGKGDSVVKYATLQPKYDYWGLDLTPAYQGQDVINRPDRDNPYVNSIGRDFAFLYALETIVLLDRFQTKTVSGNTIYPSWDHNSILCGNIAHSITQPTVDAPGQWVSTNGGHSLRVFNLTTGGLALPVAPTINIIATTDFTYSHNPDPNFYFYRVEMYDPTVGQDIHYLLQVIQARGSAEADVTASVIDSNPASLTLGTFTVTITHPTKGSATLVWNKGLTPTQGTITVLP